MPGCSCRVFFLVANHTIHAVRCVKFLRAGIIWRNLLALGKIYPEHRKRLQILRGLLQIAGMIGMGGTIWLFISCWPGKFQIQMYWIVFINEFPSFDF